MLTQNHINIQQITGNLAQEQRYTFSCVQYEPNALNPGLPYNSLPTIRAGSSPSFCP